MNVKILYTFVKHKTMTLYESTVGHIALIMAQVIKLENIFTTKVTKVKLFCKVILEDDDSFMIGDDTDQVELLIKHRKPANLKLLKVDNFTLL